MICLLISTINMSNLDYLVYKVGNTSRATLKTPVIVFKLRHREFNVNTNK